MTGAGMTGGQSPLRTDTGATDILVVETPRSFGPRQFRLLTTGTALACAAFLAAFGLGLIPGLDNQRGITGESAVLAGAAYLAGMGIWGWILLTRTMNRRARQISVSETGLRFEFPSIPGFVAPWSDPRMSITVTQFGADPHATLSFQLRLGKRKAYGPIAASGMEVLEREAGRNQLTFDREVRGKPPQTWTVWTLRPLGSPTNPRT